MRCNTISVNGNHIMEDDIKNSNSNRRRDDRVSVPESLYVIIDTKPQTMGQVVEISSTGMAFTLVDLDAVSKRLAKQAVLHLDLFAGGKGFFLRDVECRLVSNIEKVSSPSPSSLSIKRVGVQFEGLSVPQQVQINRLVRRRNLTSC
jgi:c-di-GMP-binding flagellar brake protein YcgR